MVIEPSSFRGHPYGLIAGTAIKIAIDSVDPIQTIPKYVKRKGQVLENDGKTYTLADRQVYVLGLGKAAVSMTEGFLPLLEGCAFQCLLITKTIPNNLSQILRKNAQIIRGDHPIPGKNSVNAGKELHRFLRRITKKDLLILMISGGGSSLVISPVAHTTLDDIQQVNDLLLKSGAPIQEINCVRKHLDYLKGGGLVRLANGAEILALVLSDVLGDRLDVISSGMTVGDPSTFRDAMDIIKKYRLMDSFPKNGLAYLQAGSIGKIPETIKPRNILFERCRHSIIGTNRSALLAAKKFMDQHQIATVILTEFLTGEAFWRGEELAAIGSAIKCNNHKPTCVISGGETTVTIRGNGSGGRNLELALGAVRKLSTIKGSLLVSFATDGEDGPTDSAGAWVSDETFFQGVQLGLSPESIHANNDSYTYFKAVEGLLKTGPTGTNVNDLVFLFLQPHKYH